MLGKFWCKKEISKLLFRIADDIKVNSVIAAYFYPPKLRNLNQGGQYFQGSHEIFKKLTHLFEIKTLWPLTSFITSCNVRFR